jgi:serine/threonine-protein kinase
MAPEQITSTRDVDHRADIWSVGVMIYECLTGTRPLDGAGLRELFLAIAKHKIVPVEKRVGALPRYLSNIVGRALSRTPDRRPALREIEDALERAAQE